MANKRYLITAMTMTMTITAITFKLFLIPEISHYLLVYLLTKPNAHQVNISLGSALIRRAYHNMHTLFEVSFYLYA